MPPLKRSPAKVSSSTCRVCMNDNPVMLELFGSDTQPISYADDVNKCLSLEVKKGDGLPSKICIKCAGVIGDYRPFVDKTHAAESERSSKCDSTSGSGTSCYYCLTSSNILFPVPETSISKTKDCFGFNVSAKDQICVRCQFLLEGLHELKLKACAALKQFYSNSVSVKKRLSPAKEIKKEPCVEEIVDTLKDKIKVEKPESSVEKPQSSIEKPKPAVEKTKSSSMEKSKPIVEKTKSTIEKLKPMEQKTELIEQKEVSITLLDIVKVFGEEFLKGTVSASKVLERLCTPLQINGHEPCNVSSSKTSRQISKKVNEPIVKKKSSLSSSPRNAVSKKSTTQRSQPEKKSRRLSKLDDQMETDIIDDKLTTKTDDNALDGKKRIRDLSEPETEILTKKSRKRNESERSESEKSVADASQEMPDKDPTPEKAVDTIEMEEDQPSTGTADESISEKKKVTKKKKEKMECESSSDVPQKPLLPSIVRPTADVSGTENGLDSESVKPRRKVKKVAFASDHDGDEDEDDSKVLGRKKRKISEEEEYHGPKGRGKGRKKSRQPSESDDDNDLNESSEKKKIVLDQPDFLRDIDLLLLDTPKAAFKPFICSVCHEGYISTVKGKLHKLIVHDPHANLVLQLARCDDNKNETEISIGVEGSDVKSKVKVKVEALDGDARNRLISDDDDEPKLKIDESRTETDEDKSILDEGRTKTDEDKPKLGEDRTKTDEVKPKSEELKSKNEETASDADDLFSDSGKSNAPPAGKNSEDLFNSLFEGTKSEDSVDKDGADKNVEDEKLAESGKSGKENDFTECDTSNLTEAPTEKETESVCDNLSKPVEEEIINDTEKLSGEDSTNECNKTTEKASEPNCENPVDVAGSESHSEDQIEEEKNSKSGNDEVKNQESEKVCENEAPELDTGAEVPEPLPEKDCNGADENSSDKIQNVEESKEDSKSKESEILCAELAEKESSKPSEHVENSSDIGSIETEEAVSSSIVEDQSPSPASPDGRQADQKSKGSEADVESNVNCSPEPVGSDNSSEETRVEQSCGIADAVDSTTANLEVHHETTKEDNVSNSDKDVPSSSEMPDSSAVEGIIVGDD